MAGGARDARELGPHEPAPPFVRPAPISATLRRDSIALLARSRSAFSLGALLRVAACRMGTAICYSRHANMRELTPCLPDFGLDFCTAYQTAWVS